MRLFFGLAEEHLLDKFMAGQEGYFTPSVTWHLICLRRLKHGNFVGGQCVRFIEEPVFRQSPLMAQLIKDAATEKIVAPQLPFNMDNAEYSLTEILDQEIEHDAALENALTALAEKFQESRQRALRNTDLYLSMAYDLDAYVATSMRSREDFRAMADQCGYIFEHPSVKKISTSIFRSDFERSSKS